MDTDLDDRARAAGLAVAKELCRRFQDVDPARIGFVVGLIIAAKCNQLLDGLQATANTPERVTHIRLDVDWFEEVSRALNNVTKGG